jgi:arylsulfatase A-like enzyme
MRTYLLLLVLALASCAPAHGPAAEKKLAKVARTRPNIVFVLADDHAAQALGCYGSPIARTPNMDRLAAQGMRFDRFTCGNSICSPARATLLTGVHSHVHGVIDNAVAFDGSKNTFPKQLQAAGYQTALFGKWHLKSDPTGFDHWEVLPDQGQYYNPDTLTPAGKQRREGYVSEVLTDLALDWLSDERDAQRPFLMLLHHKAPHRSWEPGPAQLALYADEVLPEPPTLFDDWLGRADGAAQQEMTIAEHLSDFDLKLGKYPRMNAAQRAAWDAHSGPENAALEQLGLEGETLTRWQYQRYVKDYLSCVAGVDASVGRVMDWLAAAGLAENTLFIYTSDQGFYLGEHGWYDKRWMYEESLRAPLIARWPGVVAAGSVDAHLTQNIDMAPTLLAAAGLRIPATMQGVDLGPLLRGESPAAWRKSIYYHYYEFPAPHRVPEHFGVATDRYKLIRYPATDEWELFDRARDPYELRSNWGDPQYADVAADLQQELNRLRALYRDTGS